MEMSHSSEVSKNTPGAVPFLGQLSMGEPGRQQGEITVPAGSGELPTAEVKQRPENRATPEKPARLTNTPEIVVLREDKSIPKEDEEFWRHFIDGECVLGTYPLEEEVDMTPQETDVFNKVGAVVIDIAEEAGVDIQMVMESIHVTPDNDAYNAVREQIGLKPSDSTAFVNTLWGMVVNRTAYQRFEKVDPVELPRIASHEFMHLGQKTHVVYTDTNEDGTGSSAMYRGIFHPTERPPGIEYTEDGNYGNVLQEALAELGSFKVMRRLGKDDQLELRGNYGVPAIILDSVILETANFHGIEPEAVENSLYRANFAGDPEALAMIAEALGPKRTEALWNMPLYTGKEGTIGAEINNAIETLNIQQIWYNRALAREGVRPPIFTWQENALQAPRLNRHKPIIARLFPPKD